MLKLVEDLKKDVCLRGWDGGIGFGGENGGLGDGGVGWGPKGSKNGAMGFEKDAGNEGDGCLRECTVGSGLLGKGGEVGAGVGMRL
ncbi:hypothetical protein ACH5RR_000727 [Cinchona calisaya]|uniref:Glycine-rich protein n=1 Tax=Cinchona calisaya TaxID=153742 RepID=A0ABD3B1N3_9GENT